MISIDELTIFQAQASFRDGTYTCHDLVSAYINRINSLDQQGPKLNAITVISDFALQEASDLDTYLAHNHKLKGPLHGIPVIVKDQCDTAGIQTAYGNICCKHIPVTDSTLVKKLRDAGAVILAKSTMPGQYHTIRPSTNNRVTNA